MPSLCPPARRSANEPAKRRRTRLAASPKTIADVGSGTGSGAYGEVGESEPWSRAGAVKRTRTSTPVKELAPQASASTNSAMTARKPRVLRREAEARRLAKRFGHDKRAGGAGAVFDFRPRFSRNFNSFPGFNGRQGRPGRRLRQSRARIQAFQGVATAFPGGCRRARRRAEALRPRLEGRPDASRRAARLITRRRLRLSQSRAQNQPFQGVAAGFAGELNSIAGLS